MSAALTKRVGSDWSDREVNGCSRGDTGRGEKETRGLFGFSYFLLFQQTASTFHGRPLHRCFLTFSSSLQSFCLESPPTPPFGSDSLTLLLSSLFLSLLLALGFKTNEGGAWGHGGLSPLYPPSSNLDKSFHGPA